MQVIFCFWNVILRTIVSILSEVEEMWVICNCFFLEVVLFLITCIYRLCERVVALVSVNFVIIVRIVVNVMVEMNFMNLGLLMVLVKSKVVILLFVSMLWMVFCLIIIMVSKLRIKVSKQKMLMNVVVQDIDVWVVWVFGMVQNCIRICGRLVVFSIKVNLSEKVSIGFEINVFVFKILVLY